MTAAIYPKYRKALMNGSSNVDLSGGNVQVILIDEGAYTYDARHDFLDDVPSGRAHRRVGQPVGQDVLRLGRLRLRRPDVPTRVGHHDRSVLCSSTPAPRPPRAWSLPELEPDRRTDHADGSISSWWSTLRLHAPLRTRSLSLPNERISRPGGRSAVETGNRHPNRGTHGPAMVDHRHRHSSRGALFWLRFHDRDDIDRALQGSRTS